MTRMSAKRAANAVLYGHAVTTGFIKDYVSNPEWFPKGLDGMCSIVAGHARQVGLSLPKGSASKEEEDLAEKSARELALLFVAFAKKLR